MLYNRVKELAKKKEGTDSGLAEKLGMARQTFQGYLNEKRQHNLWPLLPLILNLYSDVSREWLYFGEGEMFGQTESAKQEREKLLAENQNLRQELDAANRLNRQLTARLLLDGVGDKTASPGSGKAADGQE